MCHDFDVSMDHWKFVFELSNNFDCLQENSPSGAFVEAPVNGNYIEEIHRMLGPFCNLFHLFNYLNFKFEIKFNKNKMV